MNTHQPTAYTHAPCAGSAVAFDVQSYPNRKEEGAPSSFRNRTDSNAASALRELRDELVAAGFEDADELLRALAAAAGRRVLDAYRADPAKSRAWLRAVMRDGASRMRSELDGVSELDRRRIAAFDRLYERSTGREWGAA